MTCVTGARLVARFIGVLFLCVLFADGLPAQVYLWAPDAQAGGETNSAAAFALELSAIGVGVEPVSDLLRTRIGSTAAIICVLGTFPRSHVITGPEEDVLLAHVLGGGSLYIEGGDLGVDASRSFLASLGIAGAADGSDDLSVLTGHGVGVVPWLGSLEIGYRGERRSIDRLILDRLEATALWTNRDTGSVDGALSAPGGEGRAVISTFEFGGLAAHRDLVLCAYLSLLSPDRPSDPVRDFEALVEGQKIHLTWTGTAEATLTLRRDAVDREVGALDGRFEDEPGPGTHVYSLFRNRVGGGCAGPPHFATAKVFAGAHVIWRPADTLAGPTDSAAEIEIALGANGRGCISVSEIETLELSSVVAVWAVLGTHPFDHALTTAEGTKLARYLLTGTPGKRSWLFAEGGDVWNDDKPTDLNALNGVKALGGGSGSLRYLRGVDSGQGLDVGALVRLPVAYTSETENLDVIEPDPQVAGAGPAWRNDLSDETLGVFRRDPAGRFAVLSTSFEFGGVTETRPERALLMGLYLQAIDTPLAARPRFRRGDVDGSRAVAVNDPIQVLNYLFLAGALDQDCLDAADADDDGEVGVTDVVVVLNYLFLSGAEPAPPGVRVCGEDPSTSDSLRECRPLPTACE